MWLEFAWESYIGERQRKVYQTKTSAPKEFGHDQETYSKMRLYALIK